jgi:hypothetical protein
MVMKRVLFGLAITVMTSATALAERGRQVRYVGIHPIAKADGGGTCYIEAPHVHMYPADKVRYRDHRGSNFFVGDPAAHGYDGPKHAYKGHHPINVHAVVGDDDTDVEYCYLDGAHYHSFEAPEGPDFKVVGEVAFYVGTPPRPYIEARPAMVQINATYQPLVYERPVVTVDAPVGWIGARVDIARPVVVVPAPSARVDVVVPLPQVRVDIGVRAPVVVHPRYRYYEHKKFKKHKKWK